MQTPHESVFFVPPTGWVGDVIPVAEGGTARLYYLHEDREDPASGTPWHLVTTTDFVHFTDHGVALPSGGRDATDFDCYTGSVVVDDDGTAHLFYTGHNPDRVTPDGLIELQVVMHATSTDGMTTWHKHVEHTFGPPAGYAPGDWRDPFVFRVSPEGPWRMVLAARRLDGAERRRGVVAQLLSDDLVEWRISEPLWDPQRFVTHECPDVFEWNGVWYLLYSEFSDAFVTRYRMADSPDGPWRAPQLDTIDGRAFYAAKSVELSGRRYLVGWIATKSGSSDDGAYEWAGTLSTLEASQRPDGELDIHLPDQALDAFDHALVVTFGGTTAPASLEAWDAHGVLLADQTTPDSFRIHAVLDVAAGTHESGILLRAGEDGDDAYVVRLEPLRNRLVFDRWPRRRTGTGQWQISGDVPFAIELERPVPLPPGPHTLDVIVDGTLLVAVVDRRVALSARIYDRASGRLGLFTTDGATSFSTLDVLTRSTDAARRPTGPDPRRRR